MPKNQNAIIVIDDDQDDIDIIKDVVICLGLENEIIAFTDARKALAYFHTAERAPFLILCDVNMPAMNGFELRHIIYNDNNLLLKATPFIYLTTSAHVQMVNRAYALSVQGYFQKPSSFNEFLDMFKNIISYWEVAVPIGVMTA